MDWKRSNQDPLKIICNILCLYIILRAFSRGAGGAEVSSIHHIPKEAHDEGLERALKIVIKTCYMYAVILLCL